VLNIVDILITIAVLTPIAILLAAAGYVGFLVLFRRWTIYTLRTDEPLLANPGADDRREAEKPSPAPVRSQSPRAPAAQPQPSRRRRRRRR